MAHAVDDALRGGRAECECAHAVPVVAVRHRRAAADVLALRGSARRRLLPRLRAGRTGARAVLPTAAAAVSAAAERIADAGTASASVSASASA